ncbi:cytochrome c oxidase assembly protein [Pseudogemmobacter humi]|uniref:Cytochrome c oxidase caa3 assembly factor (Caa3_CtaG) n=1 Tax=Pseudogemmobacter humi TaxID=2483812 RepID=A0A3P5XWF2_9RHOB|nr:cytochrome c oxidase assembly protein [Pseudogemmobacter humi]VDC33489.1 Cytochrome c oxidase caa3 assembly factor (Caa3_CtaG) [Pseudogemmobacter humi]
MNPAFTLAGAAVLALAWAGPLPGMVPHSFAAHMALHMAVVGVGVPLLAAGLAPALSQTRLMRSQLALPVAVSLFDLIVVWGWHAPVLHEAARAIPAVLALEQAMFALAAALVWLIALGAEAGRRHEAALAGALTLFFTSMHMTLLGALIGLASRPIYGHAHGPDPVRDQQIGGAIMLVIGGVIYLAGGLVLIARVLRQRGVA